MTDDDDAKIAEVRAALEGKAIFLGNNTFRCRCGETFIDDESFPWDFIRCPKCLHDYELHVSEVEDGR